MPSSIWAVVVARVSNGAKSRLAGALDPAERRSLVLAMLADVVSVCTDCRDLVDGVIAVVDEPDAAARVEAAGAEAVYDTHPNDMNAAITRGMAHAAQRGATTAIVLPGDVPLLSRSDLQALLSAAADSPHVAVVGVSRDGQGTNALLLRPLDVIAPAFGPPSVDRHVALAQAAGARTHVLEGLDLSLDVDTPADLRALLHRRVGPNTTVFLHDLLAVSH